MPAQDYRWYGPGILKLFDLPANREIHLDRLSSLLNPELFDIDMVKRTLDVLAEAGLLAESNGTYAASFSSFGDALKQYRPPDKQSYIHQLMLAGSDVIKHVHPHSRNIVSTMLPLDEQRLQTAVQLIADKLMAGFSAEPGDEVCYLNLEFFPLTRRGPATSMSSDELTESNWMHAAFRELVALPDFQPTAEWVKNRMYYHVRQDTISATMEHLIDKKAISFNEETRTYQQVEPTLATGPLVPGKAVVEYHKTVMKMTDLAGRLVPRDDFKVNSQILALSSIGISDVINEINQFVSVLIDRTANIDQPDHVHQMNIQFFPITRGEELSL